MTLAGKKRFRIAFSFASEKRDFVAQVAAILAKRFSEAAILYDKYHEAELARPGLLEHLPDLYYKQSDLVVVVFCKNYQKKDWCAGVEWRAILALIQERRNSEVMLCRFDHVTVKSLYNTAGFMELDDMTPDQAAIRILERLGEPRPVAETSEGETSEANGQRQGYVSPLLRAARVLESRFVDLSRVYSGEWKAPFTAESLSGDFRELYMLSRDPIKDFQDCDPNQPRKNGDAA